MDIQDKIAIVTGGVSGIGSACVYSLLQNGAAHVAIFDNTSENVWLDELETKFGPYRAQLYHCDISVEDKFKSSFDAVVKKHKYVDILINAADVANENDSARLLDINVKGAILANLTAIDYMGKHRGGEGGVIVNVASVLGLLDCNVLPIYTASKHAIVSFTRSMEKNYEKIGVRILAICPGHTSTKLNFELSETHSHNYLDFISKDQITHYHNVYVQSPNNVSNAIIELITEAKAGTVWIVENDDSSFKITSPDNYTKKIIGNHAEKLFFCW